MTLHASWVHGNSALLERVGSSEVTDKSSVQSAFDGADGEIVELGGAAAAACVRLGWAARFVIFDSGSENYPKDGKFWCHYAVPSPVFEGRQRAKFLRALVNFETTSFQNLTITAAHVWDGNRRLVAENHVGSSNTEHNGGIPGHTADPSATPRVNQLLTVASPGEPVFFGLGVSLLVSAEDAKGEHLEIRGVGVDFDI